MRFLLISAASLLIGSSLGAAPVPVNPTYEAQTASQKAEITWGKVTSDESQGSWPSTLSLAKLFLESMSPSMDYVSDEFPSGRSKLIHSVGVSAQVKFVYDAETVNNLGYTGLFGGANYGVIRVSSAIQPDFTKENAADGSFIGGAGFKFFRDGVASANFLAMHLLKPWDSWNFFKYPLSNHLSHADLPTAQHLLAAKFGTVSKWATFVGLSDFARFDEHGKEVSEPKFPFQLLFVPNPQLTAKYSDKFENTYFQQLTNDIKAGTTLYTIKAIASPDSLDLIEIGTVVTTTDFVTSKYADSTMFLRHIRFEEDLAVNPQWATGSCKDLDSCLVCPVDVACGSSSKVEEIAEM